VISKASGANCDISLNDNDTISIGSITLKAYSTPGHTSGCMCYHLECTDSTDSMVFTGDTLLIRGCGRTDFQEGSSTTLYNSVHSRLFTLDDNTQVY
jgi:sulfur dioxygenase